MCELAYKESWAPKNSCFRTVVLEKTVESPLDTKKIKPVNPKGNQSWIFIESTDAYASIPWQPDWCEILTHWKRKKVKVKLLSRVRLFATPWTVAHQAPASMGFFRQEHWSGCHLKDPYSGKDWKQEENGSTENEMVRWHHGLEGYEFEQAPGVGN